MKVGVFDCGSLVLIGSLPINLGHVVLILYHRSNLRLLQSEMIDRILIVKYYI